MASVMLLPRHQVRLEEELLEASVVDAQDVPADVEVFLATREVGRVISTKWYYVADGLLSTGD